MHIKSDAKIENFLGIDIEHKGELLKCRGCARIRGTGEEFQPLDLRFVYGLPPSRQNVLYLVSFPVLAAVLRSGRKDCIAVAEYENRDLVSPCPVASRFYSF